MPRDIRGHCRRCGVGADDPCMCEVAFIVPASCEECTGEGFCNGCQGDGRVLGRI